MSATRTQRRLPGIRFEAQTPPRADALPRMDIAVFVGFAASGPLHRPVAVETVAAFNDIFGEEAPLAWDERRGRRVNACLAPAVHAFFRNGGRRCWIVRVASLVARYNSFPLHGLVRLRKNGSLVPASARARARGSWSDALQTATLLQSRNVVVRRFATPADFDLELSASDDIGAGDLLRLTFFDEGYMLMLAVGTVSALGVESASPPTSPPRAVERLRRAVVRVAASSWRWFKLPSPPAKTKQGKATIFPPEGKQYTAQASVPEGVVWRKDGLVALNLVSAPPLAPTFVPPPGTLLRVEFKREQLWLNVQTARIVKDDGALASSPPQERVEVQGEAVWRVRGSQSPPVASLPTAERLQFELLVRRGQSDPIRLGGLGFAAEHPRFWSALPNDTEFFEDTNTPFETRRKAIRGKRADIETKYQTLWYDAANPRFPLAGKNKLKGDVYLPIGMQTVPELFLTAAKNRHTALERDGLASFNASYFLDPKLKRVGADVLLTEADFVRYQSAQPRALRGIHAALEIEEATIIAVPDEVHTGWRRRRQRLPETSVSAPVPHPEWWRFLPCETTNEEIPLTKQPPRGNFLDCDLRIVAAPALVRSQPDASGTFTLDWTPQQGAEYILEEATSPDWRGASVIHRGAQARLMIYGRAAGDYFYRVRAVVGRWSSEWSNGVGVRVAAAGSWRLKETKDYSAATLLDVQRALLRMCAARGDLFAVMSLPEHYREADALTHVAALKLPVTPATASSFADANIIPPLTTREQNALSYGALYHPWLIGGGGEAEQQQQGRGAEFEHAPPSGAVCGVMARRSIERGAWIAPANEQFYGVVALSPPVARERRQELQEAQINIVRQEPRGFTVLSADTLSDDVDLRSINVRRLLMLIRRMAVRLGARYVFEPNNDAFRRLVQHSFEGMLQGMFRRGAFAGATPSASYRVNTGSPPNTSQSVEQGRFIVEIGVAPSQPLSFLTVRLVRTGEHEFSLQE